MVTRHGRWPGVPRKWNEIEECHKVLRGIASRPVEQHDEIAAALSDEPRKPVNARKSAFCASEGRLVLWVPSHHSVSGSILGIARYLAGLLGRNGAVPALRTCRFGSSDAG
jgi:hypothetical protein